MCNRIPALFRAHSVSSSLACLLSLSSVMANGRQPQCQWYQTGDVVTASLKLGRTRRGAITAKFAENKCSVFDGDELYWDCYLSGRVVPAKCKILPGKVRAEIKLKKAEPVQWTEYQVEPPVDDTCHVYPPVPTATPVASKISTPTFSPGEDLYINHLPHDYYDLGGDIVTVKVQLSNLDSRSCTVTFNESSLELKFKTRNTKFLRMYEGSSSSTTFVWNISLFAPITPSTSSYSMKPACLELCLKKASAGRWKTLEATNQTHQITSTNSAASNEIIANHVPSAAANPVSASNSSKAPASNEIQDLDITSINCRMNDLNLDTPQNQLPPQQKSDIWSEKEIENSTQNDLQFGVELGPNTGFKTSQSSSKTRHTSSDSSQSGSKTSQTTSKTSQSTPSSSTYTSSSTSALSGGHPSNFPQSPPDMRGPMITRNVRPAALEVTNPSYRTNQLCKPSLTGLCNLGNSCFMNSVIQCLSNSGELRNYLTDGRYLADINKNNPLGFAGELAKCFSQVIRKLWSGEYEYFPPKKLKSIISSRSSHFGGYQQQDAHEFMSYLLDGLHEDLNRVKTKPQTPSVEPKGRPDVEVAKECWEVYQKRNDSFLVDNFQGQFKSTLVCPQCGKASVTFDPFMSLSVPIPRNLRLLPVVFVPCDSQATPIKYILKLSPDGNLELLKASVARKTGISMTQLRVFEAYNGKFQSLLSSNQHPISAIKETDVIIVSEVLSPQAASGPVVEINVIQRVQFPLFPTKCSKCGRLASELEKGRKIQRCGQCKAVGYCDRHCQQRDWASHKMKCRQGRPVPVGLPFVISLPASQLTYSKLATAAENFARRSVKVTRRESSAQENTESAQENTEQYRLVPVDRYGDNKESLEPLTDKGDTTVLTITSQFLAMDWRNSPKESNSVTVTPKPMDHIPDPSSSPGSPPRTSEDITLDQCLELFTEPELLTKDDAWYCSKCKDHREATKQMSVWRLPHILILHLKKFSFRNMVWRDKIDKMVTFPVKGLDMSPYMLGDAGKLISPETPPIYDLYAIVNHYGVVHIGHYTAMVKPPSTEGLKENDWLCYDDENVYRLPEGKVQTKEAYILFYVLRQHSKL